MPGVIRFDVVIIVAVVVVTPSPPRPRQLDRGPDIHPPSSLLAYKWLVVVCRFARLVEVIVVVKQKQRRKHDWLIVV